MNRRKNTLRHLTNIGILKPAKDIKKKTAPTKTYTIDTVVDGDFIKTPYGSIFYTEYAVPLTFTFRGIPLNTIINLPDTVWRRFLHILGYAKESPLLDRTRLLFFDTETTGLSGGAGTIIFLAGIGYITKSSFIVRQYFMGDYDEEKALLYILKNHYKERSHFVTYNGRCFDIPLLTTRFIMTMRSAPLKTNPHLDLLYGARRLWRTQLPNCRLATLEKYVLRHTRPEEDVPGFLIPEYYFKYMRTKDARPLKGIFYHNKQDIISMLAVLNSMYVILCSLVPSDILPAHSCIKKQTDIFHTVTDYSRIGALIANAGFPDHAVRALHHGCTHSDTPYKSYKALSLLYKRKKQWNEACVLWDTMISYQKNKKYFDPFPYEEMAKYLEHYLHDVKKALRYVDYALRRIHRASLLNNHKSVQNAALLHRRQRLVQKTIRQQQ